MIKGLIGTVGRISRDAAIMTLAIYVFVWAAKELNPASLIREAESRQITYVDKRLVEKEKLDEVRHQEQMRAVSRIDGQIHELGRKIDKIIEVRAGANSANISGKNLN